MNEAIGVKSAVASLVAKVLVAAGGLFFGVVGGVIVGLWSGLIEFQR